MLTVDAVILFGGKIVLIKRDRPPYEGHYALPGGFVEIGENTEDAALREAKEETGLDIADLLLVGVYSDPDRDPRGHTVSICYLAIGKGELKAGSDARSVHRFTPNDLPPLAFDHQDMIRDALDKT